MAAGKSATDFDLIIAGASFAGLVAARSAALRGLSVAVLERKRDPGENLHTTGILVKEAARALDIPAELTRPLGAVRLYAPNLRAIDLAAPGYYFLASDTGPLLRWLADEAARAGAQMLLDTPFRGAAYDGEVLRLDRPNISTRYLIGADGARSRVAEAFGLGRNARFLRAAELEFPLEDFSGMEALHCFIDASLAPGYIAWAVPGVRALQVGLARSGKGPLDLEALVVKLKNAGLLRGTARAGERRAGLIPAGGLRVPFAAPRVLLIGDAAGLVSPVTGGGIFNAIHFGRQAALAVADHLLLGAPEPSRVLAPALPKYRLKGMLRRGFDLGAPDFLPNLLLATPPFRAFARALYFHERGAKALAPADRYCRTADAGLKRKALLVS